jgi:hypothetical protein
MTQKYFNTNDESGEKLIKSRKTVEKQEDRVLRYFQARAGRYITRHQIERELKLLTPSAQRSLTNLTGDGKLLKTDKKVMERHGKMVHTWILSPAAPPKQMDLF